uniref:Uncharacterized protein n=1 Tax=Anopheles minimus TaxID=112268 RepID=A0A182WFA4_9DIPT
MGPPTESSPLVIIDVQSPAEEARNGIAQGNEDDIELVNFSSANSLESRINYVTKAEPSSTSLPRIGLYIKNETTRNRNRQILFATTIPRIGPTNLYMVYLNYIDIQSIRYTKIPTIWPQCNVFQQNELTVNLNPEGCPGLFSVPLRDNQACEMLGLPVGGKGREAFLAVLRHVGKVRYGSKEPAKQYYIMSVTEKVLHLLFATVPPCPRNGGLVLFPKIKSCLPADGDDGYLERFNYYVHTKRAAEETANKGESL